MKFKRIILIVLDSLGIGEAADAKSFGDEGANTLLHIVENNDVLLPNLQAMGMLNLIGKAKNLTNAYYGRVSEISNGKDTLTGHLEMMGIKTSVPSKTFTEHGFPAELIAELEQKSGRRVIGNCDASGTEIIDQLGIEHIKTGALIVYTSADSVLQIAAHESVIPVKELYRICEIARTLTLKDEWKVGRIIARPFIGKPGFFERTANRKDYALDPSGITVLDSLKSANYDVVSIGKISDIFNTHGITENIHIENNLDGIDKIIDTINTDFSGLCFANLNDFDSKFGHRRDVDGYANAILDFDNYLYEIVTSLKSDDLLMITADHGNDPSWTGTDHTRENVPLLVFAKNLKNPKRLSDLDTFGDIGATIADNFGVAMPSIGHSFLGKIK